MLAVDASGSEEMGLEALKIKIARDANMLTVTAAERLACLAGHFAKPILGISSKVGADFST